MARKAKPEWKPEVRFSGSTQYLGVKPYGMDRFDQLFTDRQLVALTTFSDLVQEARERVKRDALAAGLPDDGKLLVDGGTGATLTPMRSACILAFVVSKEATSSDSCALGARRQRSLHPAFGRQAIPMIWDFAEAESLCGGLVVTSQGSSRRSQDASRIGLHAGHGLGASNRDATTQTLSVRKVVSTDPPYYDNVGYADLSDFFYVWLRRSLKPVFPDLFATLAVPKAEELVAFAYRHGGKAEARRRSSSTA